MRPNLLWVVSLVAVALVAGYLATARAPKPLNLPAGAGWEIESVMLLDGAAVQTYRLRPPFRVIRGGRVVLDRRGEERPTLPIVRLDLTIDGEPVTVFARPTNLTAPGAPDEGGRRPSGPSGRSSGPMWDDLLKRTSDPPAREATAPKP
jgi:hypothetical protein